jgi:hypothetical protein
LRLSRDPGVFVTRTDEALVRVESQGARLRYGRVSGGTAELVRGMSGLLFLKLEDLIKPGRRGGLEDFQHGLRKVVRDMIANIRGALAEDLVGGLDETHGVFNIFTGKISELEGSDALTEIVQRRFGHVHKALENKE